MTGPRATTPGPAATAPPTTGAARHAGIFGNNKNRIRVDQKVAKNDKFRHQKFQPRPQMDSILHF